MSSNVAVGVSSKSGLLVQSASSSVDACLRLERLAGAASASLELRQHTEEQRGELEDANRRSMFLLPFVPR
eukprot:1304698-Prymnesium_polylepis.1